MTFAARLLEEANDGFAHGIFPKILVGNVEVCVLLQQTVGFLGGF